MKTTVSVLDIHKIVNACHPDPFSVLGIHELTSKDTKNKNFSVRCYA